MSRFYYLRSGQAVGPIDENRLQDLIQDGTLMSSDQLFKEGSSEWKPVLDFVDPELFKKVEEALPAEIQPAAPQPVAPQISGSGVMAPPPLPEVETRWVLLKRKSGASGNPEFDQKPDLKTIEVEKMIADRKIEAQDFLWKEGFKEWTPANQVSQFKNAFESLLPARTEVVAPPSVPASKTSAPQVVAASGGVPTAVAPQTVAPVANAPIAATAPVAVNPFADLEKKDTKKSLLESLNLIKSISPEAVAAKSATISDDVMSREAPTQIITQAIVEKTSEPAAVEPVVVKTAQAPEPFVMSAESFKKADLPEAKPEIVEAPIAIKVEPLSQAPRFKVDERREKNESHERSNSTASGASKKSKRPIQGKGLPLFRFAFAASVAAIVAFAVYEWKVTKGALLMKYAGLPPETAEQIFGEGSKEHSMPIIDPAVAAAPASPPVPQSAPPAPPAEVAVQTPPPVMPPPAAVIPPPAKVTPPPAPVAKTIVPPPTRPSAPVQKEMPKSPEPQIAKKMEPAGGSSEFVVLYPVPLTLSDDIEFSGVKAESLKVSLSADAGQVLGKIRFSETKTVDKPLKGKWGVDLSDWNLTEGSYQLSVNGDTTSWSRRVIIAEDPAKLKNALEIHRKKISYQVQKEKKQLYQASRKLASQVKELSRVKKGSVPSSWFRGMKAANTPQMVRARSSSEDMAFPEQWKRLGELHTKLSNVGQLLKTSGKRAPAQEQSIREVEKNIDVLSKKIGSLSLRFD